jgi:DNA-binding MarR family transcriptional regulator/GNAT superfamily N-acetyltransferase
MTAEQVAEVRAFNRSYTRVIGVLEEGMVGTPYSLSEARVLYELAQRERTDVTEVRRTLGMDAGYASRLLGKLEERGLIRRDRSEIDARKQVAWLTEEGKTAQDSLEWRTVEQVSGLLDQLGEDDQQRLLGSMKTIRRLVGDSVPDPTVVLRAPRPGDLGWVVQRHGALYAREYGWNEQFEAVVAKIVAEVAEGQGNPRQAAWIAEVGGERVGSVFCMPGPDEDTAKLRLLLLEPEARGAGLGKRLVSECVEFARGKGYRSMELWTMNVLAAARAIYQKAGFRLTGEEPVHEFGAALTSETWRLEL